MPRRDGCAVPSREVVHGGAPDGWLDFSVNLNPCGTPPAVSAAVVQAGFQAYATLDATPAEQRLAADAGVERGCVLLTAGATEGLRLVCRALLRAGETALVVGPTYGEYTRQAMLAGARVVELRASPPGFAPPLDAVTRELAARPVRAVFLCDPNNPTGAQLVPERLRELLRAVPPETTLVVDQSFLPFAEPSLAPADLLAGGNVVLLRSLTKVLATPGVRVGYLIANEALVRRLRDGRDPWPVGAHAIAAAAATSWRLPDDALRTIRLWRARLEAGLPATGLSPLHGGANFLLAHAGMRASRLADALAARRIAIRRCDSFDLPEYLRVAVRPPDEQDRLFAALAAVGAGA